ncbi:MAG: hypothetical protein NVS4B3_02080 [Gemmatimonadaceae bacterium]
MAAMTLGALVLACSKSTAPSGPAATMVFRAAGMTSGSLAAGGHTLTLSSVGLLFRDIELVSVNDPAGHDCSYDAPPGTCAEFENGVVSIALPVSGASIDASVVTRAPAGAYPVVEPDITSAHVVGSYDGRGFDVTLAVAREPLLRLPTVLQMTGPVRIAFSVNLANWFMSSGALDDPGTWASGSAAATAAADRVAASFSAAIGG